MAITEYPCPITVITIHTDSKAALKAFGSNNLTRYMHAQLSNYMNTHASFKANLKWVLGHKAINGNQQANALPKT